MTITQIYINVLMMIKRLVCYVLLYGILGWRHNRTSESLEQYKKGKYILIYAHTSWLDGLIGYMFGTIHGIPIIGSTKKETQNVPILGWVMKNLIDVVFIDRDKNMGTVNTISDSLKELDNYVFIISPEGSRKKVNDIRSGFFNIARNTEASLVISRLNYVNQTIELEKIASSAQISTTTYENIKSKVIESMSTEAPYHPHNCHLIKNPDMIPSTSIINIQNSMLLYIPLVIVSYIFGVSIYRYI